MSAALMFMVVSNITKNDTWRERYEGIMMQSYKGECVTGANMSKE